VRVCSVGLLDLPKQPTNSVLRLTICCSAGPSIGPADQQSSLRKKPMPAGARAAEAAARVGRPLKESGGPNLLGNPHVKSVDLPQGATEGGGPHLGPSRPPEAVKGLPHTFLKELQHA